MMRIKTYTSDSVPQALIQIKEDLGPGAVILKTNRTVKKKFLGLIPSMAYEITAAADPSARPSDGFEKPEAKLSREKREDLASEKRKISPEKNPNETYEVAEGPVVPSESREGRVLARARHFYRRAHTEEKWMEQFERLSDEIQSLVRLVSHQQANDTVSSLFLRDEKVGERLQQLIWQSGGGNFEARRAAYQEFRNLLLEGVDESFAFLLIREVFQNFPADEDTHDRLRIRLNRLISRMIQIRQIGKEPESKASIFVGPTGVGKTTTIAKLSARFALKDRRKVKLLTFDTYRIAAAEQLKTYGEIIGVPVKVLFTLDELDAVISDSPPDELVLIDTTGHSHKKIGEYLELSSYVRRNPKIETHLVLSCTTRPEDLREIVSCFGVFDPDSLLFTKLDESSAFGAIFNQLIRTDRPLSYLTNGQDVAEDLITPSSSTIADLLVPVTDGTDTEVANYND